MGGAGERRSIALALLAAALYALSTPFSKVLLAEVGSSTMAALLYLGAGAGMGALLLVRRALPASAPRDDGLRAADAPYVLAMVLLDVAAPVLLMAGLATTSAASVSLLNNFEIVATAVIARVAFRERVDARTWAGIVSIAAACCLLAWDGSSLAPSPGSLLVFAAATCWGVENNCTNRLSERDPVQVVVVKGWGSGAGALVVALLAGEALPPVADVAWALLLGFAAYGLSIACYVRAQRGLGAARTSAYYAVNPFVGAVLSFVLFRTSLAPGFVVALALMALGSWLVTPAADDAATERGASDGDPLG